MKLNRQLDKRDFWKGFYTTTALLGLILIYLEIFLYRRTFIDVKILLLIILSISLISFIFNRHHYKRIYDLKGNFFPLMQNILSWGFISCYLFMAANYYLADSRKNDYIFTIKSKSSIPGASTKTNRQPTIKFDFRNYEKELVFYYSETAIVDKAQNIRLQIRKGALGFDIIDDYKLIIEKKINNR